MGFVYRPIDPGNYDEVYSSVLFCEYSWRDSSASYVADSDDERKAKAHAIIERLRNHGAKYCAIAAFDGPAMAGIIALDLMTIDKRPACHVQSVWVHPDYRGHGIATRLKLLGEEWAKEMGAEVMDSNVRVENEPMIRLNQQLGYDVARLNFRKRLG